MDNELFGELIAGVNHHDPVKAMANLAQLYESIRRNELTAEQRTTCYRAHTNPIYSHSANLRMLAGLILSTDGVEPNKDLAQATRFLTQYTGTDQVRIDLLRKLMYLPVSASTPDPSTIPGNPAILAAFGNKNAAKEVKQLFFYLQAYAADPASTQHFGFDRFFDRLVTWLPEAIAYYTRYTLSTLVIPEPPAGHDHHQEEIWQSLLNNPFITDIVPPIETTLSQLSPRQQRRLHEHLVENQQMKQDYEAQKQQIVSSNNWPKSIEAVRFRQQYPLLTVALIQGDTDFAKGLVDHLTPRDIASLSDPRSESMKYFEEFFKRYPDAPRSNFLQWVKERATVINAETQAAIKAAAEAKIQATTTKIEGWLHSDPSISSQLVSDIYKKNIEAAEVTELTQRCSQIQEDSGRSPAEKSQALALQGMILANATPAPAFAAAISYFDKAIALDRNNHWARTLRGAMYAKGQGGKVNRTEAAILLKTASAADHPAAPTALYWLGSIYDDPKRPGNAADALALYWQAYRKENPIGDIESRIAPLFTVDNVLGAITKCRTPTLDMPRAMAQLSSQEKTFIFEALFANPVITEIPDASNTFRFMGAEKLGELKQHLINNQSIRNAYDRERDALMQNPDLWQDTLKKNISGFDKKRSYSMLELSIRYGDNEFTQSILRHMPREQLLTLTQARADKPVDEQHPFEKLAENYPNGVRRNTFRQWVDDAKQNPLLNILNYLEGKSTAKGGEKLRYNARVADFMLILKQLRTLATEGGQNAVAKHDPAAGINVEGERPITSDPATPNFDDFKDIFVELLNTQHAQQPITGQTFFGYQVSERRYLEQCEQLKKMPGEALFCCIKQFDDALAKAPSTATVATLRGEATRISSTSVSGPVVRPEDQSDSPKAPSPFEEL